VLQMSQAAFVGNADPGAPWDNEWFGKNAKFGGWHVNVRCLSAHSILNGWSVVAAFVVAAVVVVVVVKSCVCREIWWWMVSGWCCQRRQN
jgi:hypothetical protein